MAGCVPARAQDSGAQPLRGSIAPQAAADGVGQGTSPTTPALGAQAAPAARAGPKPPAGGPEGLPLGGLGDEPVGTRPAHPLGGMGDETPTDPREGPEELVAPEESFAEEEGLTLPVTEEILPRQIHTALNPEPHDLDSYLPIGIKIGSFLLFPEAAVGTVLTNNVLDTLSDTHGDVAAEVAPKMRLESNWTRHSFTAEVNADQSWYRNYPIENESNYQGVLRGRIDVTTQTHLRGEAEISQTQQGPSSINLTDISGAQNTTLQEQHVTASADHTFNRLTLKLTGTLADYNYDEVTDPTLVGPVPFVDIRDYSEAVGTLRSTYEFQSAWAGFVEAAMNERDYKAPLNEAGFMRGSSGYTVQGGVNLRLSGTLFGEISAGYGHQDPIDDHFQPISGPLINGDLIWMPSPLTKLEFLARSEIDETTLVDSLGAIDRFYELSLQHAFWRYLVLGIYGSYEVADFVGDPEIDRRTKGGATAEYYFNPVMSVYGRYEHTVFTSTPDATSNFVEDEVRLGLKIRR